jgi:opacity protein-like surface antigen
MKAARLLCLVLVLLAAWAPPAAAEWFVDLYLGVASTRSSEIETTFPSGVTTRENIDWRTNVTLGARGGYWFLKPAWLDAPFDVDLGGALDVSLFAPAGDTTVIPISALLMARVPLLKDEDFPQGRLQPYVGFGPGIFVSRVDGGLAGINNVSDTSVDIGFDFRAGAAFRITELFSLFAEYRYTHVRPEFSLGVSDGTAKSTATFNTHHFVTGLGFRF